MERVRYPDFLESTAAYDACTKEWLRVWDSVDTFARELHQWREPWLDTSMRDGNPIFSAWSPSLRQGVRVIQHGDPTTFVVWRNTFASGTPDAVDELVIDCALTDEHLSEARKLIADWVADASERAGGRPPPAFEVPVIGADLERAA